jgi:sulfur-carrier protein
MTPSPPTPLPPLLPSGREGRKVRIVMPFHLQNLARVSGEVSLDIQGEVSPRTIIDALEARYPALQGAIRDHGSKKRRSLIRFFACEEDISHEPLDTPLPAEIANGKEPFFIIGAIAGG